MGQSQGVDGGRVNRFAKGHRDDNHGTIVKAFRKLGCSVVELDVVGSGCPDLLVGYRRIDRLIEVKDGAKVKSRRQLRASQTDFIGAWRGAFPCVVETVSDVITLVRDWGEL